MLALSALAAASFSPLARALAGEVSTEGMDVGLISRYGPQGIYPEFASKGFFLMREGNRLVAQSSLCTHKQCKLTPGSDGFTCKCHGSAFTTDGRVTRPPAKRNLDRYAIAKSPEGHVIVNTSRKIDSTRFDTPEAYIEIT